MIALPEGRGRARQPRPNRGLQIMENAGSANPDTPPWRTASMCNGGSCVRVAPWRGMVLLGDTKSPDGPVLAYTHSAWNQFIARMKRGEYGSY
jgi:Domain of unknown function (DUF397)